MGLEEIKKQKKMQAEIVPKYQEALKKLCGTQLIVEWKTFKTAEGFDKLEERALEPVKQAFEEMCSDSDCKKVVQDKIKKVVIKYDSEVSNNSDLAFSDGVVTVVFSESGYYPAATISQNLGAQL